MVHKLRAENLSKTIKNYKIIHDFSLEVSSGEVVGLQDSTVMLAYYFGGKQYATDTAKVVKGKFTFKGKKELKGGVYLIVLSDQQYFDIIISDTHFSFKTDINDLVGAMSFKNSVENPPFYKYLTFISEMQKVLASCMGVDTDLVSIKSTTTEKLSFVGREEGVSAYATVLIQKN